MLVSSTIFILGLVTYMLWMFQIVDNRISRYVFLALLLGDLIITNYLNMGKIGWVVALVFIDLYILFYAKDYDKFKMYCIMQISSFALIFCSLCLYKNGHFLDLLPILYFPTLYIIQLWIQKRNPRGLLLGVSFFTILFFHMACNGYKYLMLFSSFIFIYFFQSIYNRISRSFENDTKEFQNQVMGHHYEEVKSIYLNMRGWRHDYHNHIQTLKAYLALEHYDRIESYLGELEADLAKVDNLVKSGNLMVDAILNSKLSLAKGYGIEVKCKVLVPEHIRISDIDICVLLGNLLDNAIEACNEIDTEKRFIRIYGDIVQKQFYFFILNSSIENLNFNQKNYVSEKRGEHGHGLKRVNLTVDKYDGYIKLKNEPGVFATEIMIPL